MSGGIAKIGLQEWLGRRTPVPGRIVSGKAPPADADAQRYLDELGAQKPLGLWDSLALDVITAGLRGSSGKSPEVALARKTLEAVRDNAAKHSFIEIEFDS